MTSLERRAVWRLLESAGIPGDGVLFVHCAFRRLGAAGLRADAFIETMLDYMRSGTVVMPAMSWRIVTPTNPFFDELTTPSHVGVLAERYRLGHATHRSLHPTHSVSARGALAEVLTAGHHLDDTPCSLNSPYGKATREPSFVLLLGIGLERCTAIHHAEEMIAPAVYLHPPSAAELYHCRKRDGTLHQVRLRRHLKLNRHFPQFTRPLLDSGRMKSGNLEGTRWLAVAQTDLLSEVTQALQRNPGAIIAPEDAPVIP